MTIRAALGATRSRIVVQLVLESGVIAAGGALAGVVLAWWGTRVLVHLAPENLPRLDEIHVDYTVLGFAPGDERTGGDGDRFVCGSRGGWSFLALNAADMGFQAERMLVMNAHAPA